MSRLSDQAAHQLSRHKSSARSGAACLSVAGGRTTPSSSSLADKRREIGLGDQQLDLHFGALRGDAQVLEKRRKTHHDAVRAARRSDHPKVEQRQHLLMRAPDLRSPREPDERLDVGGRDAGRS